MTHKIDAASPPAVRAAESVAGHAGAARAGGERAQPVAAAAPADSLRLTGEATELQALQRELGAAPADVDAAKVERIRAALADGSYQINPREIATRLLALERALGR